MTTKRLPPAEETELNMTPMIDVVFQLIVFFLLSLKFKTVEDQISTQLPKNLGIVDSSTFVEETPTLRVKLFREGVETPDRAFTRVRVAHRHTFELPGHGNAHARASVLHDLSEAIHDLWAARGYDPDVQGEIRTPAPKGAAVPHGDVMAVLDAFLRADLLDVKFQGTPSPLPSSR